MPVTDRKVNIHRPPRWWTIARQQARERGEITYSGQPHSCGGTIRYTSSSECVNCYPQRRAKSKEREQAAEHAPDRAKCESCGFLFTARDEQPGGREICGMCIRLGRG